MTKRDFYLAEARIAGYHDDSRTFMRLVVSSRVSREVLNAAWISGKRAYAAGIPCTHCQRMRIA